jgi:serine/threonine protein kinase/WD40 repeat protein
MLDVLCDSPLLESLQRDHVKHQLSHRFPDPAALARELLRIGWITGFQARQLLEGKGSDLLVGQYVLLEPLGQGNMGQVFKARHHVMGRIVALKVLRPDRLKNPVVLKRFRREVHAVSKLSHPNIVAAHDASEVKGVHFLVMEYVEGTELGNRVRESGALPVPVACEYARQTALGLQHAHERGMVHRDVKPANLLVTPDGAVKILDMGLARLISSDDSTASLFDLTRAGTVMGTPNYIAPEQAMNPKDVDIRADVYSLGCTLHFMLTGQPPFTGSSLTEVLLKHQTQAPPVPPVAPALQAILRKMMAKSPAERFATPKDVAEALAPWAKPAAAKASWWSQSQARAARPPHPLSGTDDALQATIDEAPPAPPLMSAIAPEPADTISWRLIVLVIAILLLLAVVCILLTPGLLAQVRGLVASRTEEPSFAGQPGPLDALDPKQVPLYAADIGRPGELVAVLGNPGESGHGRAPALAFSQEGRRLAVPGDEHTIVIWDVLRGHPASVLRGHTGPVNALAITPDGKYLASGSDDRSVRVWDLSDLAHEPAVLGGHTDAVNGVAFSPDGRRLASASNDRTARLWSSSGAEWHDDGVFPTPGDALFAVAFPADGTLLAAAGADQKIHLWDLTRSKPEEKASLQEHAGLVRTLAASPDGKWLASGSSDQTVRLWDLTNPNPNAIVLPNKDRVRAVAFSPDNQRMAMVDFDDHVFVYLVSSRQVIRDWKLREPAASVCFAPGSRYLAVGNTNGTVYLFRLFGT